MANLNRIILVGRPTADPESRTTLDGIPMTRFRLAMDRPGIGNETDFVDIVAWRKAAEACSGYVKKGQIVLVEGRIQNRSFEDPSGQRRWVTEVVARNVQLLEKGQAPQVIPAEEDVVDDGELAGDLPF